MPYDPLIRLPTKRPPPGGAGGGLPPPPAAGNLIIGQGASFASKPLSGDATITAGGVLTLSNTGVTAGTYGDATHVGQFTVSAEGRLSFAQNVAISGSTGSTGPQGPPGMPGDDGEDGWPGPPGSTGATGSAGATGATGSAGSNGPPGADGEDGDSLILPGALDTVNSTPGSFGSASFTPTFTVDEYGRITTASQVASTGGATGIVPITDRWFANGRFLDSVNSGAGGVATFNMPNVSITLSGTPSGPIENTTHGEFTTMTASGTATSVAGTASSNPVTRLNHKPLFFANIFTDTVKTAQRIWIGLTSSVATTGATLGDTDTPGTTHAISGLLFRGSSVVPDSNWQVVTCNGSTETVSDSGVAWSTATAYRFRIDASNTGSILFYINDTLVKTATLTLPGGTTNLNLVTRVYNTTSAGKTINIKSMDIYDQVL